jgi:hypothetical protein
MSPVHVGELNTEVTSDVAPAGGAEDSGHTEPWEALDRVRDAALELARLHDRTRAEGFDV